MWPRAVRVTLTLVALALVVQLALRRPRPSPATSPAARDDERRGCGGDVDASEETNETAVAGRPWFMRGGMRWPQPDETINRLFPEDAPGEDRIVEQLMYALPNNEEVPIKTVLLANGFSAWGARAGRTEFTRMADGRGRCPVHRCALTDDPRHAATADAVLFKDYYVDFGVERPPNQIWMLYYLESPLHTPPLPARAAGQFNWTAGYRRDADLSTPYGRWAYYDPRVTQRELTRNYAANKTKKVAWFVSNCNAGNGRHEFARELARHISVDVYGACGALRCPKVHHCWQMLKCDYKFYLAFENSNCQDYISEKLFENSFGHDVLPIVMGARVAEYQALAPRHSFVHVEEFPGAAELAAYLRALDQNDELYNSYFKWKGTGEFLNMYFWCRVCALLHASDRRRRARHYADVRAWWRHGTCTRGRWTSVDNTTFTTLNTGGAPSFINVVRKFFSGWWG